MRVLNIDKLLDVAAHTITFILILILGKLDAPLGYFFLAFLVDTGLGVYIAIKNKQFSKKYFISKTLEKVVFYSLAIFFGHIGDQIAKLQDKIRDGVLFILFIKEAPSVLAKLKVLGHSEEAEALEKCLPKQLDGSEGSETKDGK